MHARTWTCPAVLLCSPSRVQLPQRHRVCISRTGFSFQFTGQLSVCGFVLRSVIHLKRRFRLIYLLRSILFGNKPFVACLEFAHFRQPTFFFSRPNLPSCPYTFQSVTQPPGPIHTPLPLLSLSSSLIHVCFSHNVRRRENPFRDHPFSGLGLSLGFLPALRVISLFFCPRFGFSLVCVFCPHFRIVCIIKCIYMWLVSFETWVPILVFEHVFFPKHTYIYVQQILLSPPNFVLGHMHGPLLFVVTYCVCTLTRRVSSAFSFQPCYFHTAGSFLSACSSLHPFHVLFSTGPQLVMRYIARLFVYLPCSIFILDASSRFTRL